VSEQHHLNKKSMIYHIYLNVRWGFSPLNLVLKYAKSSQICVRSAELDHGKLDRSQLDHAEPNQGLHHQIIMWIPQMFQNNLLAPPSKVNKSKRENRVQLMSTDTIFVWGTCPSSNFLKKQDIPRRRLCVRFQAQKHLTWYTHKIELFSITAHHRNSNLLRHAPENKSSPRVVIGKWLLKKN
jgi:hypothetical protein